MSKISSLTSSILKFLSASLSLVNNFYKISLKKVLITKVSINSYSNKSTASNIN